MRTGPVRSIASGMAAPAAFLCLLAPAQADEPPLEDPRAQLQRVEVSARREREDPQTVPISISSFTADDLLREDVRTVTELERNVPGLSICCSRGQASFAFLRGIQGVQGYFAETLLLGPQGEAGALSGSAMYFDMETLSVLKGPQGTLFGMSTNGGAVLFTPNRPEGRWGGRAGIELGDHGRRIFEAVLNAPLSAVLKIRFGVQSARVDGFVTDRSSGIRLGGDDYSVGRLVVSLAPSAAFDNQFYLNQFHSTGRLAPYVPVAVNPVGTVQAIPGIDAVVRQQRQLGYYQLVGLSLPAPSENINDSRQAQLANVTTLRLGKGLRLKNILGYSRQLTHDSFDADGTPFRIYDDKVTGSRPAGPSRAFSEELQLQGQAADGRLRFTAGLFHVHRYPGKAGTVIADLGDVYGIRTSTTARSRFETRAVYAQASLDLDGLLDRLKGWRLTAGYRLHADRRWLDQRSSTIDAASQEHIRNAPLHLRSASRNNSYTLGAVYQLTPTAMAYLTNSKGFLNGGFNTSVTQATDAPYAPESLNNFELGWKADFEVGEAQVRTNVAAYCGLYSNAQVSVTSRINTGTPSQALAVLTKNAAKGRIEGLEWNLQLVPHPAVELMFFGAWMKNRYTHYASLDPQGQPVDLSGTPFVYSPRFKYGLSAAVFLPINAAHGQLQAAASITHQDGIVSTSTPAPQWYDKGPGFHNLNLSLHWSRAMGRPGLSASVFVNNATGNRDANGGFGAYRSLGILGYSPAVPRMAGVRVEQRF